MRATYDRLRAAGKPPKLALTAVMRKLLALANALLNANRTWTPKTARYYKSQFVANLLFGF
jgi:transposase